MRRRQFLAAIMVATAARPLRASAEAPTRIFRIGFLAPTAGPVPETEAFFDALSKLGYHEGRNLIVERRFAANDENRLQMLATEIIRLDLDVIVVQSTTATRAAMSATKTIPIVMGSSADAIGTGLVPNLSHPGGNVTGISFLGNEWAVKHVQLILELRPGARRLAFLGNYLFLVEPKLFRNMQEAAVANGASMRLYDVRMAEDYERAFASMREEGVDGLVVATNVVHRERRYQLVALAAQNRLPAVYGSRDMVEAGGLASYGVNFRDMWSKAADYVDRILKGAKPGDLPVEQPTKFELVINLKTARELGLNIPPSLLARADEVIE